MQTASNWSVWLLYASATASVTRLNVLRCCARALAPSDVAEPWRDCADMALAQVSPDSLSSTTSHPKHAATTSRGSA